MKIKLLFLLLLASTVSLAQVKINLDTQLKGSRWPAFGTDAGSANAYNVTTIAPLGPSLRTGSKIIFKAANGNTGASTLVVDGSSAIPIKYNVSSAIPSGCILTGEMIEVLYDGTNFQLLTYCNGTGAGTVTNFTAGNLSPLFTTSVATGSSTPALTFALSNAAANTIFGNFTGSSGAPSYNTINSGSSCGDSTHALSYTNGTGLGCQSIPGPTVTHAISFTIGDPSASTALTSGSTTTDYLTVPFGCTIQAYNLAVDAGTITVKFWKVATGTAIPTVSNSISTSGVSISSGTAIHSTTLTDFTTTTISANDILAMNVSTVATAKYVNGVLQCQ